MATVDEIAEYIWKRSQSYGVNPSTALGIARYEGLNPNTLGSKTFGNPDAKGYSFGPFQLYSGSPDPSKISPGGMAYEFQQKFGQAPSRDNWQQQVDFSLETMAKKGTSPWYAVRDRGGEGRITELGSSFARQLGLGGGQTQVASADDGSMGFMARRLLSGATGGLLGGNDGGKVPFDAERPYSPSFTAPQQPMGAQFAGAAPVGGIGSAPGGAAAALTSRPLPEPDKGWSMDNWSNKDIAGLASIGNYLMAAGAPKQTWQPGPAPKAVRGQWRDDIFAGLLG